MHFYLLQRLCQMLVKDKTQAASIDCKLLRRNDFLWVFHRRNTTAGLVAPGLA
jgi:hypothetical protein